MIGVGNPIHADIVNNDQVIEYKHLDEDNKSKVNLN